MREVEVEGVGKFEVPADWDQQKTQTYLKAYREKYPKLFPAPKPSLGLPPVPERLTEAESAVLSTGELPVTGPEIEAAGRITERVKGTYERTMRRPALPVGTLLRKYIESSPRYDPLRKQIAIGKGKHPYIEASVNTLIGLAQVDADVVEGLSTPENVALLGVMAVAPEAGIPAFIARLTAAGFSLAQAKAAADKIVSSYQKYRNDDLIGAGQDAADAVVQATFAILAGRGAAHPNVAKLGMESAWTEFYKKEGLPQNLAEQAAKLDVARGRQPPVVRTAGEVEKMEAGERATMTARQTGVTPRQPHIPAVPPTTPIAAREPERAAPPPDPKSVVEQAGGRFIGMQEGAGAVPRQILFNDPQTGTTLAVPAEGATPEAIRSRMEASRREFAERTGSDPERAPTGTPAVPTPALEPSPERPAFIEEELRARAEAEGVPEPPEKQVGPPTPELTKSLREQRARERGFIDTVRGSWDQIADAVSPGSRGPAARVAALRLRKAASQIAANDERAAKALNAYKAMFDRAKLPMEASLDFIDRYETAGTFVDSKHQQLANLWRSLQTKTWREVMKREGMNRFIEDYFPHLFKDEAEARRVFGRRPMLGPRTWRFKRQFPTMKEALAFAKEQGVVLEPAYDNPVSYMTQKLHEMNKYIAMYDFIEEMKGLGILKFRWVGLRRPEGMKQIEDPVGTVYGPPRIEQTLREAHDEILFGQLNEFARSVGIDHIRKVKLRGGPTVWGYTIKGTDKVWTKFAGPEQILTHELGHQLHFRYPELDALIKDPATRDELRKLADMRWEGRKPEEISDYYKRYVRVGTEKIANLIHAYVHMRERARQVAPVTIAHLENIIDQHPELQPLREVHPGLVIGSQEFKQTIPLGGQLIMGHYYAPEPAARVINNYLKPGMAGKPLYDLFRYPANLLNQIQLGTLSFFHMTFTGMDTAVGNFSLGLQQIARGELAKGVVSLAKGNIVAAPIENFIKGNRVLEQFYGTERGQFYRDTVNRLIDAGGRVKMDAFYHNSSVESFLTAWRSGNKTGVTYHAIPAAVEAMSYPVMQYWVPRLKLGAFSMLAEEELAKLGPNADLLTQQAALARAWDSVDNRLGQLVYDDLFWSRTQKDLGMLMVRSLGWNLGTMREIGGGYMDIGKIIATRGKSGLTPKAAYTIALPIVIGMHGAMLQYLLTGKGPTQLIDYIYPQTGKTNPDGTPERVAIPSYAKDEYQYFGGFRLGASRGLQQAGRTLSHKANPELAMVLEMLRNRDFYGTKIYNEDSPAVQQAKELAEYIGGSFEPFWIRNIQRRQLAEGQLTPKNVVESMFGILPAPKGVTRDAGEALAAEYLAERMPEARTREQAEKGRVRGELIRQFRTRDPEAGKNLAQAMREKKLTAHDRSDILRSSRMSPIEMMVEKLPLELALNVYEKTSPQNQEKLKRILRGKLHQAREHPELLERLKRVFTEREIENTPSPEPSSFEENLGEVPVRSPFQSAIAGRR